MEDGEGFSTVSSLAQTSRGSKTPLLSTERVNATIAKVCELSTRNSGRRSRANVCRRWCRLLPPGARAPACFIAPRKRAWKVEGVVSCFKHADPEKESFRPASSFAPGKDNLK